MLLPSDIQMTPPKSPSLLRRPTWAQDLSGFVQHALIDPKVLQLMERQGLQVGCNHVPRTFAIVDLPELLLHVRDEIGGGEDPWEVLRSAWAEA